MLTARDSQTLAQPTSPDAAAPDPTDIDMERALWDLDYRAQVLQMLQRARLDSEK
jgi:hypothetical protein